MSELDRDRRLGLAARALRRVGALGAIGAGLWVALGPGWGIAAVGVLLLAFDVWTEVRG